MSVQALMGRILGGETQAGKNRILCMSEFRLKKGICFSPFMEKCP